MIKLFRRIRQKLLAENKFSKYLLYAIGEIVLVVIGILIALQINNNNTFNKERETEQAYLTSLHAEFDANLELLHISIEQNEIRITALEKLLTLFDPDIRDTTSSKSLSLLFHPVLGSDLEYEPSLGVLNDIISSGKLSIISNKELRQSLASFERALNFLKKQEDEANQIKQILKLLMFNKMSVRNIQKELGFQFDHKSISDTIDSKAIFNSIEFENNLTDYLLVISAANDARFMGGIQEHIAFILQQIELEIDKE